MTRISAFLYSIKQGLKNIKRNRMFSLASIGTIAACLFLFGIFFFIISNLRNMIQTAETAVAVTAFFDEGITDAKIEELKQQIKKRAEVKEVTYISGEQAWEHYKEQYLAGKAELVESFAEDNPLADSASFEIYLSDISMQESLVRYVNSLDGIRQVNSSDTTAKGLTSFNLLASYISVGIIAILLAVSIFLISTTVTMGIAVRKEEISIMKLIGATDYFIRAPFIVEGVIIGLIGAALPLLALYFIYEKVITYILEKFQILSGLLTFLDINIVFKTLVPVSLIIGIGIGFVGSMMTVRKHLKV